MDTMFDLNQKDMENKIGGYSQTFSNADVRSPSAAGLATHDDWMNAHQSEFNNILMRNPANAGLATHDDWMANWQAGFDNAQMRSPSIGGLTFLDALRQIQGDSLKRNEVDYKHEIDKILAAAGVTRADADAQRADQTEGNWLTDLGALVKTGKGAWDLWTEVKG